jgi:hypothetical protein
LFLSIQAVSIAIFQHGYEGSLKLATILTLFCSPVESLSSRNCWRKFASVETSQGFFFFFFDVSAFFALCGLFVIFADDKFTQACNQSIIAPAVIELTLNICPILPFKDGGGWRIEIMINSDHVSILHRKRQKSNDGMFEFEWELSLVFDREITTIIGPPFSFFS